MIIPLRQKISGSALSILLYIFFPLTQFYLFLILYKQKNNVFIKFNRAVVISYTKTILSSLVIIIHKNWYFVP